MLGIQRQQSQNVRDSYRKIENRIKKCRLSDSLVVLSKYSLKILEDKDWRSKLGDQGLHPWILAYIAKVLLKTTSDAQRPKVLDYEDYLFIANLYYEHTNPLAKNSSEVAPLYVFNATYEQFYWQDSISHWIPRYYLIFAHNETESNRISGYRSKLEETFVSITGFSIIEYMRMAFAIWASMVSNGTGLVRESYLVRSNLYDGLLSGRNLSRFFDTASTGKREIRKEILRIDEAQPIVQKYTVLPIFNNPLIRMNGDLVSPIPQLLLDKATHGIYFTLLNHTRSLHGSGTSFTEIYGEVFQDYIRLVISEKYEQGEEFFDEHGKIYSGYQGKRADFTIFEDDFILAIEVKASRIPRRVIESWELSQLREYITSRFLSKAGVGQLAECVDFLRREFPKKRVVPLMLVNDIFPHFNALKKLYFDNTDRRLLTVEQYNVQFIDTTEFECLFSIENKNLASLVHEKYESEQYRFDPFLSFLGSKNLLSTDLMLGIHKRVTDELLDSPNRR